VRRGDLSALALSPGGRLAATPARGLGLPGLGAVSLDGAFAMILFAALLFAGQLGTAAAVLIVLATGAYGFSQRDRLRAIFLRPLPLLAVPSWAIFSVVWSQFPGATLKYGAELLVTVAAALLIAAAPSPKAVLKGLLLAFLLYAVMALAFGGSVGMGAGGQTAFSGLSDSKNLLADIASTGCIISLAVLAIALTGREPLWMSLSTGAAGVQLYLLIVSRSAGAVLGLGVGVATLAILWTLLAAGRAARLIFAGALGLAALAVAIFHQPLSAAAIAVGSAAFDKDPTLTGRTYLWYRAADLIAEHPLLGRGYSAFWVQGNIDAEGLWRYAGIGTRGGFNFHNLGVEILVHLGWVGLVLVVVVLMTGAVALVRRFVVEASLSLCFWFAILVYQLVRTPIESVGLAPFHISTLFVFAALAAAFTPRGKRAA
jgi:exopolysaccharide production protein ExoQ